jgi:hypothetical protein
VQFEVDGTDIGSPVAFSSGSAVSIGVPSLSAGPHVITAVYSGDGNFVNQSAVLNETVGQAPLTITGDNQTKLYGAALPTLTASYSGFVNGDTVASLTTPPALATTATAASHAGSYDITASGASDPNYLISYLPGTLAVTPAPLTITADNKTMTYGGTMPTLTVSYDGLVNGDTPTAFRTSPNIAPTVNTVPATSHAGTYAITASGAADADYAIAYVAGTLTISPAPLTITATNQTMVYGGPLPTLMASYSGLVNGDTPGSLTTPPGLSTTTATASSPVGTYAVTASGAVDPDYRINYVPGTLTITPAPLTVTDNQTQLYGIAVALSPTYTGFVPGPELQHRRD